MMEEIVNLGQGMFHVRSLNGLHRLMADEGFSLRGGDWMRDGAGPDDSIIGNSAIVNWPRDAALSGVLYEVYIPL